jgi:aconitate hydratase
VIAESFERIHRSNLIGMGVIPLQFPEGQSWKSLKLTGAEKVTIQGVAALSPRQSVAVEIAYPDGSKAAIEAKVRIDTENELDYYRNGGILHYVLRQLARAS